MFDSCAKLALEQKERRGFRTFQRWLQTEAAYEVIIDGANVGFNNQNFAGGHFQYKQIEMVAQQYRDMGKKRILIALHPKRLKEDADIGVPRKRRKKALEQVSKLP